MYGRNPILFDFKTKNITLDNNEILHHQTYFLDRLKTNL